MQPNQRQQNNNKYDGYSVFNVLNDFCLEKIVCGQCQSKQKHDKYHLSLVVEYSLCKKRPRPISNATKMKSTRRHRHSLELIQTSLNLIDPFDFQ